LRSSCGGDSWTWVPHCRSRVLPSGTTRRCVALISGIVRVLSRESMALAQIFRFLSRERVARKRLYRATASWPFVGHWLQAVVQATPAKQYLHSSCGGGLWTWVPRCRSLVLPCGTTRRCIDLILGIIRFLPSERMALAQIFRFLPRERTVRKRLYCASTSCPLVGTLAASCRAGNFGETVFAFLLWWGLVDLGAALPLAGPTMWNDEDMSRLDIVDNSFPPK
jgi:hypothetical protein